MAFEIIPFTPYGNIITNKKSPYDFLTCNPTPRFYSFLLETYNIRFRQNVSLPNEFTKTHLHTPIALRYCVRHDECVQHLYIACPFLCLDHYDERQIIASQTLTRYLER